MKLPIKRLEWGFAAIPISYNKHQSNKTPYLLNFVTPFKLLAQLYFETTKKGRNINLLSIPFTSFGKKLGPPNPWLIFIAKETLGFRWQGISPCLWLLVPTFSLPSAPLHLTMKLQCKGNSPLPSQRKALTSAISVIYFSPVTSSARYFYSGELLRIL